jgi:hypothetical protein
MLNPMPNVDGSDWTIDTPHKNNRYSWQNGEWVFIIRDVGSASLWRLHAREKATGQTLTWSRDFWRNPAGDGVDGFQPLFGAALRRLSGRMHPTDEWQVEAFPHLLDNLFEGL